MFKRIVSLFFIIFFFFLFPRNAISADQFQIDVDVSYKIIETGVTHVTHTITLTNLFSNLYAKTYTLSLDSIDPQMVTAREGAETLPVTKERSDNITNIKVDFNNSVTGKGASRTFTIEFDEASFATRTGKVWEIAIPRLSDPTSFDRYDVTLLIPEEGLGKEAYISPEPVNRDSKDGYFVYTFSKDEVAKSGITAGFGEFQVFSFTLNYHLENPLNREAEVEIALPPDTSYQRIYYEVLEPRPQNIRIDEDGNWLGNYKLSPRKRIDITASGSVQIFSDPRKVYLPSNETLENNTKETSFWQTTDPQIKSLAEVLQTPSAIYDYVSTTLNYDYDRVRPNVERLGAKGALENPEAAICMEFTDLFVAIARAAGIPAREVNGFAYTENPDLQPLSLVADVLHAWPEYWDGEKKAWIPIDPTWGSTTGGVDFFNKLDLRHFTFVNHGNNAVEPYPPGSYKLGANPQKDVFVNFGQLPKEKTVKPKIEARTIKNFPFFDSIIEVKIENPGPSALYSLEPKISGDFLSESFAISALPPFASETLEVKVPFSFLGTATPEKIKVEVAGTTIEVPTYKNQVIIYNVLAIFIIIAGLTLLTFLRVKGVRVFKFKKNGKNNQTNQEGEEKEVVSQENS